MPNVPGPERALQQRRAAEVAAFTIVSSAAWLSVLPAMAQPEWADIAMEASWAIAVGAGYVLMRRAVYVRSMEIGWRLVFAALAIEVLDEFTVESKVLSEYMTGSLGILGLMFVGVGLQQSLRHELAEMDARARAEERERLTREDIARANQALREALQNRDDIVSIVAHDFRSPLTLIRGYAELLHARAADEETRRLLEVVAQQAQHLAALAADTLTMSRLDAGNLPLDFERLRLDELLRRVTAAGGDRIRLDLPDGAALETTGDAGRLEQVMQNLLDNALKYSPAGSPVRVAALQEDGGVRVSVRDDGPGIAPAEVPLLFQKFSRLPGARRDGISGTGLGLYICRAIVEGHGGRIWVDSVPGRGATFHVLLPPASDLPAA